jgi:hypothetical protein
MTYIPNRIPISTKEQLECDHDHIIIQMSIDTNNYTNVGNFCEKCNVRLDGPHGLLHYQEKIKYQEEKKK